MPFVLRSGSGGSTTLVGPCYVDDIMDGEAVAAAQAGTTHTGPLWSEKFRLAAEPSEASPLVVQRVTLE